ALEIGLRLKLKMSVIETLEVLGMIYIARQEFVRAARLWGAGETLRAQIGVVRDVVQAQDMAWVWNQLGEVRSSAAWQAAWAEGVGFSLEEAVKRVLFRSV
ncbi:MAG TPA: hypothetical protein PK530_03190, partial [Anaerolineales bacterium]|nr:hypothetical protein [Anaerolineales bacterium]